MNDDTRPIRRDILRDYFTAPRPADTPMASTRRVIKRLTMTVIIGMMGMSLIALIDGGLAQRAAGPPEPAPTPVSGALVDGRPPGWKLAFEETFDDNHNAWMTTTSSNSSRTVTSAIVDGALRWDIVSDTRMQWSDQPKIRDLYGDAYISADIRLLDSQPDEGAGYGIGFRKHNPGNLYWFTILDTGNFFVGRHNQAEWRLLRSSYPSSLIRSHAHNRISVLAVGHHAFFYINEVLVHDMDVVIDAPGRFILQVYLDEGHHKITVVFDNVRVYIP